jgi:hypothetical protein
MRSILNGFNRFLRKMSSAFLLFILSFKNETKTKLITSDYKQNGMFEIQLKVKWNFKWLNILLVKYSYVCNLFGKQLCWYAKTWYTQSFLFCSLLLEIKVKICVFFSSWKWFNNLNWRRLFVRANQSGIVPAGKSQVIMWKTTMLMVQKTWQT